MPDWEISVINTAQDKILKAAERMKDAIGDMLDQAGDNMVNYAKRIVPVKTGRLQSSIYYTVDQEASILTLGASAPYALYVEFGTRRARAQPYLRPSIDYNIKTLRDAMAAALANAVNK